MKKQAVIPSGQPTNRRAAKFTNDKKATTPPQPIEENMEVHHHNHSHGKRNWKSYGWEFVMLFLAVFCGFLAEYQLEHKIERDRAEEVARSFYSELKADADEVKRKIAFINSKDSSITYLRNFIKDSSLDRPSKMFSVHYNIGLLTNRPAIFEPKVAVLNLLINSGSLRYFKNKELQQLIVDLSNSIANIKDRNDRVTQYIRDRIDPFIISHHDDAWIDKMNKVGFATYRSTDTLIPFHLYKTNEIDRISDVNRLGFFSVINKQNATIYYPAYDSINAKLLGALEKEFRMK